MVLGSLGHTGAVFGDGFERVWEGYRGGVEEEIGDFSSGIQVQEVT
jgi:hypothetical protein